MKAFILLLALMLSVVGCATLSYTSHNDESLKSREIEIKELYRPYIEPIQITE